MDKEDVIRTMERQLRAVKAERLAASRDPALLAARTALKQYQAARLAHTHADLLAAPGSKAAATFFLNELYGADAAHQRDVDLERVVPTMQRILPLHPLQTITNAIVLDALSEQLDTAMAQRLGAQFSADQYAAAYRDVTPRAAREQQLALVQNLGDSLSELVRVPFLSATLSIMRGPARLAGLGQLQQFLEHGFASFKQLREPRAFVASIVARERALLEALYANAAAATPKDRP